MSLHNIAPIFNTRDSHNVCTIYIVNIPAGFDTNIEGMNHPVETMIIYMKSKPSLQNDQEIWPQAAQQMLIIIYPAQLAVRRPRIKIRLTKKTDTAIQLPVNYGLVKYGMMI